MNTTRCMILSLAFWLAIPSSAAAASTATSEGPPAVLAVGEQRLLHIPQLERFSLGGHAVRSLKTPTPSADLLLKGAEPGISDLWLFKKDGTAEHRSIRVIKLPESEIPLPLERALGRLSEVEILTSGTGVILRGEVRSLDEAARIRALALGFPKAIVNETTLSNTLLAQGKTLLEKVLKSHERETASPLILQQAGGELWVRGSVNDSRLLSALENQLRNAFPSVQMDIGTLPDNSPTVHFKVFLLELKASELTRLGLRWPESIPDPFRVTELNLTLDMLESSGSARVLSQPELVVRAPGEAELFSGGEIPIHVQSRYYSNVSWKSHGLLLKLKVTHSTSDRVRLEIQTEVSHLDSSQATQGPEGGDKVPGLQANRMKTQIDARYGQPLFLSGLLQESRWERNDGVPWFRKIPLIGSLFGSSEDKQERSELVAILIPNLTPPPAPLDRMESRQPKGPLPTARNWLSPEEERKLRQSPDFPWNAFQEET